MKSMLRIATTMNAPSVATIGLHPELQQLGLHPKLYHLELQQRGVAATLRCCNYCIILYNNISD
jgi:hypothetical protein